MGGGCHPALAGQPAEKGFHLGHAQLRRMPQPMEEDEGPAPVHVGVLGAPAVVQLANLPAHLVEQANGPLGTIGRLGNSRWRHHGGRLDWQMIIHPASLQRGLTNRRDLHPMSVARQLLLLLPGN
jgi:hypothetical protein